MRFVRSSSDRNFEGFIDEWHKLLRECQKDELFEPILKSEMFLGYMLFAALNLQGSDLTALSEKVVYDKTLTTM